MEPALNEAQLEAWVKLATEAEVRSAAPAGPHPYEVFMGGVVSRMARLLMAHPRLGPAFRQLSAAVLFGPGALSRTERELVGAVAAAAQDCFY
jgi:hypothetical protein